MVYQSYILLNLWQVLFSPGKLVPPTWNQPRQQYFLLSETWVQGDTVMAKIVTADVEAINGRIQFIDTILGIPYLDMTNLICSDLWLL
jgi:hypothetical protein